MTNSSNQPTGKPLDTNALIAALTADLPTRVTSVLRALLIAIPVGIALAGLMMSVTNVHVRGDFLNVFSNARFTFKFVFTLTALAAGIWLALRLSRPGTAAGPALAGLVGSALVLAAGAVTELAVVPASGWGASLMGVDALKCVVLIPVLALAPLTVLLVALRTGAPDNPTAAGAAAGLVASGIAATLYASHCTNDSPLYVAAWYVLGMAIVTGVGALAGSRALRW
jgi:hypothetical protein